MKNKISIIFVLLLVLSSVGCTKLYNANQPKEKEIENSPVWPMSGEWWVTYTIDGTSYSNMGRTHYKVYTYNTSANVTTEMWIKTSSAASILSKVPINLEAKTFNGANLKNNSNIVNISDGKVISDGGKSRSGVVVDSIYFEAELSDMPGKKVVCSGVRRTGFLEDEY